MIKTWYNQKQGKIQVLLNKDWSAMLSLQTSSISEDRPGYAVVDMNIQIFVAQTVKKPYPSTGLLTNNPGLWGITTWKLTCRQARKMQTLLDMYTRKVVWPRSTMSF